MKNNFRKIISFGAAAILILALFVTGCDSTSNPTSAGSSKIAAVTNLKVTLGQASNYYAIISWTGIADNGRSDFTGYTVITYAVDSNGNKGARLDSNKVSTGTTTYTINSLQPAQRYQSYVYSESSTSGYTSDSAATIIYGAVFVNTDSLDEYMATGPAMSGYGWNGTYGIGTRYSFTTGNLANIDLHVRNQGGLQFFSPLSFLPGGRTTTIALVGGGQTAFDQSVVSEPTAPSLAIVADNVYVIKTQSNYYIKIWVQSIGNNTAGFQYVKFKFKVQSVAGLRVL